MITPYELSEKGWKRRELNGGIIVEYNKFLDGDESYLGARLSVRYGEFKDEPYAVWLIFLQSMRRVHHADNVNDLETLYSLLRG